MSQKTKIWLMIAASLTLVGAIIFAGGMTAMNWDFNKLATTEFETHNYTITDAYQSIAIVSKTADIRFLPSDNTTSKVVCHEQKNLNHSVSVQNGTLTIKIVDERKWYEYIGINIGTPKITVYIPQGEYGALSIQSSTGTIEIPNIFTFTSMEISQTTGDVTNNASVSGNINIKATTGDIRMENISASNLSISVTTGKITVSNAACTGDVTCNVTTGKTAASNIQCQNLISNGDTGDVTLTNVIAAGKFNIERNTGDVKFDSCDAAELTVKTDTGDVTGSLLTDKVFITQTDTGRIDVPKSVTGGKCEITTDTGNIKITIK